MTSSEMVLVSSEMSSVSVPDVYPLPEVVSMMMTVSEMNTLFFRLLFLFSRWMTFFLLLSFCRFLSSRWMSFFLLFSFFWFLDAVATNSDHVTVGLIASGVLHMGMMTSVPPAMVMVAAVVVMAMVAMMAATMMATIVAATVVVSDVDDSL